MNKNKTLSCLASFMVVLAMLFSLVPFGAYAENETESSIKISDYTAPEGKFKSGEYFVFKGKISSARALKYVQVGIFYRNEQPTPQIAYKETNSKEFDISTIDSQIYFDALPDGLYRYNVTACDDTGNMYNLVSTDFQIGDVPAKSQFDSSQIEDPFPKLGCGEKINIKCDFSSAHPIYRVYAYINDFKTGETVWELDKYPNKSKDYMTEKTFSVSESLSTDDFKAGSYKCEVCVWDYTGEWCKPISSEFIISKTSEIKVEDGVFPEGELEQGKEFKIQCAISSNQNLLLVESKIYKKDTNKEVCKLGANPNDKFYVISEENKNTFDIATLEAGEYTYQLTAVDSAGYKSTLKDIDFSVKKTESSSDSKIEVSDTCVPSGVIKQGTSFGIKGKVTSTYKLKSVTSKIVLKDGNKVVQNAEFKPDSTSFNFFPDLDYSMVFNKLETGKYTFIVDAEDEKGYKKNIVTSDFEISSSSTDSKIEVSDVSVPSGVVKQGTYFNLRGKITSKYKLKSVTSKIILKDNNKVMQNAEFKPDRTSFNFFPDLDYSMIFNKLETGKYTFIVDAEDEKGYKATVVKSDFEIGPSNVKPGDATLDGIVDIADVVAAASYVSNPESNFLQPVSISNCDVHNTGDGLTGNDVLKIQQYIAKVIDNLE